MHLKRWITGVILLPPLVLLVAVGPPSLLALLVALVSLVGLWEYFHIVFIEDLNADSYSLLLIAGLSAVVIIWAAYQQMPAYILTGLLFNLVSCAFYGFFRFRPDRPVVSMITRQVCGVVYVPLPLSALVLLYSSDNGAAWIFLVLAVVFSGDTAAFYVGRTWGRRKLCPAVSPGKTIEGAVGGVAGSVVAGSIVKLLALPELPWQEAVLLFVAAAVLGQAGDLFESILKRTSGVKDSGRLLPGHGGFLDRIDALLFAAPVTYLFSILART